MKVLVFSDSHSHLSFMRMCMDKIKPQAVIHLGDHYSDAQALQEDYPGIPFYMVAGNCDRYEVPPDAHESMCPTVGGVRIFMTHGHRFFVKNGLGAVMAEARRYDAKAVLFGHTHIAFCSREEDLLVFNPGSCGYYGGSAGLLEIENKQITACRIMGQAELEEYV